ncbi:MAG: sigma-70 family RNA polymerase sigma factor [Bacteroidales bacterium]|nr:sigma-70 family RNA polymerase sigma factor [Bacteroidales bacterium]
MSRTKILTTWVVQHTEEMVRWAFQKTSSEEIARDLVQDTFLAAAEKYENFQGKSTPKTWLFAILNNKIVDHYRKQVRQPTISADNLFSEVFDENGSWQSNRAPKDWHQDEEHLLDNEDFKDVLKKCMEALPDNWHSCVRMKYLLNKSGDEICQELGIAPTNYWQIIHRAKLQLRQCIDSKWFAI